MRGRQQYQLVDLIEVASHAQQAKSQSGSGSRLLNYRFWQFSLLKQTHYAELLLHTVLNISITNALHKASYPANGVQGQSPETRELREGGIPRLEHVSAPNGEEYGVA